MKKSAVQFLPAELRADIRVFKKGSDIIIKRARRFLKVAETWAWFYLNSLWAAADAHSDYLKVTHDDRVLQESGKYRFFWQQVIERLLYHCFETIVNIVHVHQIQNTVVANSSKFKISLSLESVKFYFNKRGKVLVL